MKQMMDRTELDNIEKLRSEANIKLHEAERVWHISASALPIGSDREKAFDVCENIRNAA